MSQAQAADEVRLRFAAFDLDGTLLGPDGELLPGVLRGLDRLRSQGLRLWAVTGRTHDRMVRLSAMTELSSRFEAPLLLNEGDVTWDHRTGRVAAVRRVPDDVVGTLRAAGMSDLVIETAHERLATTRFAALRFALVYQVPRSSVELREDVDPIGPLTKVYAFHDMASVIEVLGATACEVDRIDQIEGCVMLPPTPCKARGLEHHLEQVRHGSGLSSVLAFGDGPNDACLLAEAGFGVAVSPSHPKLRQRVALVLDEEMGDYLGRIDAALVPVSRVAPVGPCPHARTWPSALVHA